MAEQVRDDKMSAHEKFMLGIPLRTELARLHDGIEEPPETPRAMPRTREAMTADEAERPLTKQERLDLRELVLSAGWPVLQRLIEKSFHRRRKSAISTSCADPLADPIGVAKAWAYAGMAEQVAKELVVLVAAEMELLEEKQGAGSAA